MQKPVAEQFLMATQISLLSRIASTPVIIDPTLNVCGLLIKYRSILLSLLSLMSSILSILLIVQVLIIWSLDLETVWDQSFCAGILGRNILFQGG